MYNLGDNESKILKQTVREEIQKLDDLGLLINPVLIKNNINANPKYIITTKSNKTDLNYNINQPATNSSVFANVDKIISISFLPTNYIDQFGNILSTPQLDVYVASCDVAIQKQIINNYLINEKGSIKEYVYEQDYIIKISGILIGQFGQPSSLFPQICKPVQDIQNLISICESKISVKINSPQLSNLFGITNLSIKYLDLPNDLKDINLQRFTIQCESDNNDLQIL